MMVQAHGQTVEGQQVQRGNEGAGIQKECRTTRDFHPVICWGGIVAEFSTD